MDNENYNIKPINDRKFKLIPINPQYSDLFISRRSDYSRNVLLYLRVLQKNRIIEDIEKIKRQDEMGNIQTIYPYNLIYPIEFQFATELARLENDVVLTTNSDVHLAKHADIIIGINSIKLLRKILGNYDDGTRIFIYHFRNINGYEDLKGLAIKVNEDIHYRKNIKIIA